MDPEEVGDPSKSSKRIGLGSMDNKSGGTMDASMKLSEAPESIRVVTGGEERLSECKGTRKE